MGEAVAFNAHPTDICFNCHQRGHWHKDCTSRTPERSQPSIPVDWHDLPVLHCPCGAGICTVRTSRTAKNPDRKFYSCPCGPHDGKCGFFKWCDSVNSFKSEVPMCSCGAGRCSVVTETTGPDAGRRYFACRVPKGHGACPYFQWEDAELNSAELNSTINKDVSESKSGDSLSTRNDHEATGTVNVDLGDGKHDNAAEAQGNNCKVTRTSCVDSGRGKHIDVPKSEENDNEFSRGGSFDSVEDKLTNLPQSARSSEVTHTVSVDSSRGEHDGALQSKENDSEVPGTVNVELGEDKHADLPQSAESCEVTHDSGGDRYRNAPQSAGKECEVSNTGDKHANVLQSARSCEVSHTVHVDSSKCKQASACKYGRPDSEVTHTVNDNLGKDKYHSAGNKCEVTRTVHVNLDEDKHADGPQSERSKCKVTHTVNVNLGDSNQGKASQSRGNDCEVVHTINVDLGEGKYSNSTHSAGNNCELSHTVKLDLHSKRMRSDLSLVSYHLCSVDDNLSYKHSKKMRRDLSLIDDQHHNPDFVSVPKPSAEVKLPQKESSKQKVSTMDEPSRVSCLSKTKISPKKFEFSASISVIRDSITGDLIFLIREIFGFHAKGWLGQLVFPPRGSLTVPPPKPFFCGAFPSFSAITVPKCRKKLLPRTPHPEHEKQGAETQTHGTDDPEETSAEQQAVRSFRSNLLTLLKSMDPRDHKYMERVANPILDALDHLSPNNSYFREHVNQFIRCSSELAQTELPSSVEPSAEHLIEQYNKEKARFREVTQEQAEAVDAFKASREVCSLLRREASRVKKMLAEVETRLACSEMEGSKLKARVHETCEAKKKCGQSLQNTGEAIRLRLKKEEEVLAAKEAFNKARNQLVL